MPLNAIVEVVVHFDEFVNLYLFKKGLYRIDLELRTGDPNHPLAVPYSQFNAPSRLTSTTGPWTTEIDGSDSGSEPAKIVDERSCFCTRAVHVRYNDEHHSLNDGVMFRAEKALTGLGEPMTLRAQLCRADVDIPEPGEGEVTRKTPYELVATQDITIQSVFPGVHAYWPLSFDSSSLCLTGCMVHAALVGVQFREAPRPSLAVALSPEPSTDTGGASAAASASISANHPPRVASEAEVASGNTGFGNEGGLGGGASSDTTRVGSAGTGLDDRESSVVDSAAVSAAKKPTSSKRSLKDRLKGALLGKSRPSSARGPQPPPVAAAAGGATPTVDVAGSSGEVAAPASADVASTSPAVADSAKLPPSTAAVPPPLPTTLATPEGRSPTDSPVPDVGGLLSPVDDVSDYVDPASSQSPAEDGVSDPAVMHASTPTKALGSTDQEPEMADHSGPTSVPGSGSKPTHRPTFLHDFLFPGCDQTGRAPSPLQLTSAHAKVVGPLVRSFVCLQSFLRKVSARQAGGPPQEARFGVKPSSKPDLKPSTDAAPTGGGRWMWATSTSVARQAGKKSGVSGARGSGPSGAGVAPPTIKVPTESPEPPELPLSISQTVYSDAGMPLSSDADSQLTVDANACVAGPTAGHLADGFGVSVPVVALREMGDPGDSDFDVYRANALLDETTGTGALTPPAGRSPNGEFDGPPQSWHARSSLQVQPTGPKGVVAFVYRSRNIASAVAAARAITAESHAIAIQLFVLWHELTVLLPSSCEIVAEELQLEWYMHMRRAWLPSVTLKQRPPSMLCGPPEGDSDLSALASRAAAITLSGGSNVEGGFAVRDSTLLDAATRPFILAEQFNGHETSPSAFSDDESSASDDGSTPTPGPEPADGAAGAGLPGNSLRHLSSPDAEVESSNVSRAGRSEGVHVIVFQNGLNGYRYDLRLLQALIKMLYPYHMTLGATSNQAGATEGDISLMGSRLAGEVHNFITDKLTSEGLKLRSLSFVGFSLGGVIIRAALRHDTMRQYLPHLKSFVTLASPHLGLLYGSSSLFDAGVYVMRKWKKQVSLGQLSCSDSGSLADCLLYRLCVGWRALSSHVPKADGSDNDEEDAAGAMGAAAGAGGAASAFAMASGHARTSVSPRGSVIVDNPATGRGARSLSEDRLSVSSTLATSANDSPGLESAAEPSPSLGSEDASCRSPTPVASSDYGHSPIGDEGRQSGSTPVSAGADVAAEDARGPGHLSDLSRPGDSACDDLDRRAVLSDDPTLEFSESLRRSPVPADVEDLPHASSSPSKGGPRLAQGIDAASDAATDAAFNVATDAGPTPGVGSASKSPVAENGLPPRYPTTPEAPSRALRSFGSGNTIPDLCDDENRDVSGRTSGGKIHDLDIYGADFVTDDAEDAAPSPHSTLVANKMFKKKKRQRAKAAAAAGGDSAGAGARKGRRSSSGGSEVVDEAVLEEGAGSRHWRHRSLKAGITGKAFRGVFRPKNKLGPVVTEWLAQYAKDHGAMEHYRSFGWEPNGQLLRRFEHVVLVGSAQDKYTPYHSHRAETCLAALKDSTQTGSGFQHMVDGFWSGMNPASVLKLDVHFSGLGSRLSVDSMLGREAHLLFLESQQLAYTLVFCFPQIFD